MFVQRQQVARTFAAQNPAARLHGLQHVAVAHLGAHQVHASGFKGQLNGHIRHQGTDHARQRLATAQALVSHQVEQLIAVVQAALGVHHLQAVGVAVQRHAKVGLVFFDCGHQGLGVGGAHLVVDVQPVGRAANGDHVGAEFMKDFGRNLVGRAVGGIHHNLQALEGELVGKSAFAKLDVAASRVVQAARLTQTGGLRPLRRKLERRFHFKFPGFGQLGALGAEKLDAVVFKHVVAGADHHAQRRTLRPC